MTEYAGPRQLRRLLDAVMSITHDLDQVVVLERIVEAARDLVDARYAALGVLDPTGTYLTQFITVGLDASQRELIGDPPKGHGILGMLIVQPKPLRLLDLREHPDSFGFPLNHPPMKSFLGVPLFVRGKVFGNLYLTDKRDGAGFSDIDEELALGLAAAAAVAIENARLHQKGKELSVLADQERIGRDLHDTVVQRLFATGLALQATARIAAQPEVAARLERNIDDIDGTIRKIRSAIFAIDIARSPDSSLRRDVLEEVAGAARVLGFQPTVDFSGPVDTMTSDNVAAHLLAVLREALSNVARHAEANQVKIVVGASRNISLDVTDDGIGGIPPSVVGGNGLRDMKRRARELGGRASIGRARGHGTRLQWIVPLPAAET